MQTDMYYTSGVKLFYKKSLAEDSQSIFRLRLGYVQEIYTPRDLESREVVENDYPYTGLQYGLLGLSYSSRNIFLRADVWRGVQGQPAAMGKVQNFIHKVTGSDPANGWDNQTEAQNFWNGDFMILKRFVGENSQFSPWVRYKFGDLITEAEPGLRFGMRGGIFEFFTDFSVVFVDYNAILQGPKSTFSSYIISDENMNKRYYKADIGGAVHLRSFSILSKATWTSPQFKHGRYHGYMTLGISYYW